jgi:replication-associated recombination protein RarA
VIAKCNKFIKHRVEKYRPQTLSDLISHEEIIGTIKNFIEKNQMPHLLFYGPAGTGEFIMQTVTLNIITFGAIKAKRQLCLLVLVNSTHPLNFPPWFLN